MTAHQIFYIIGISKQSYKCCHEEQGIQECGKESGYCTCHIGIADFSHAFKNISEADTVQKTWDKALDKGKYRIDTEKHNSHCTGAAYSDALEKAGEAEDRSCHGSSHRAKDHCTDGYRDHVKGNGQWPDVQISQWCVGHQQKDRCHQAQ